jgi:hypothetical protein
MTGDANSTLAEVVKRLEGLERASETLAEAVRKLEAVVRVKIATPVVSLSTTEAADILGCSVGHLRRLLERDLFTDVRAGKRSGSPWRLMADEVDIYRLEGEDSLTRFRREMGRA